MVNVGHPSGACKTCKLRRIKCDQTFPHCNKCKSTGRQCPGVPKNVDVMFRNETVAVGSKARSKERKKAVVVDTSRSSSDLDRSSPTPSDTSHSSKSSTTSTLVRRDATLKDSNWDRAYSFVFGALDSMSPFLRTGSEDIIMNYFLQNFIIHPKRSRTFPTFHFVLSKRAVNDPRSGPLFLAVSALASASIGNYPGMGHLREKAFLAYGKSVRALAAAIKDPTQIRKDETLLSIMMLTTFESIEPMGKAGLSDNRHLEGALAICRSRGQEQFKDLESLKIFRTFRDNVVSNSALHHGAVDLLQDDPFWYSDEPLGADPIYELSHVAGRVPSLQRRAYGLLKLDKTPAVVEQIKSLVFEALELDKKLIKWNEERPSYFEYKSFPTSLDDIGDIEEHEAFPGLIHMYGDFWSAQMMNYYRSMRIHINKVIALCASSVAPELAEEKALAVYDLQEMVDEICFSVPYHINHTSPFDPIPIDELTREQIAAHACGATYLAQPLAAAFSVPCVPESQHRWILSRLKVLSDRYAIQRAKGLADVIEARAVEEVF